jgi:1,2-phenylacetyl-CoA epoxidase catalytic subunit
LEEVGNAYGDAIIDRMHREAARALQAARLSGDGLHFADEPDHVLLLGRRVNEETQNFTAIGRLHEQLLETPLESEKLRAAATVGAPRLSSWVETAIAHWLWERAGWWQLSEYVECSWVPWQTVVNRMIREKRGLQSRAERFASDAAASVPLPVAQSAFEQWLPIALGSLGNPGDPTEAFAMAAGLRQRMPESVMEDFLEDIKPACRVMTLSLPDTEQMDLAIPPQLDWSL